MPYSSETTIILNHALENQNNLEMALDVCSVCDDLRGILIIEFVEKLKTCALICLSTSSPPTNSRHPPSVIQLLVLQKIRGKDDTQSEFSDGKMQSSTGSTMYRKKKMRKYQA